MTELLRFGDVKDWANALEKARGEMAADPQATAASIISWFGGMGSLNDVILYKNGQPLIAENTELDALASELYQLCHEI